MRDAVPMNCWRVMGYDTFAREPYCVDLNLGLVTVLWSAPLSVRVRSRRIRRLRQPQNEHLKRAALLAHNG